MIESRTAQASVDGLTGGALWRCQALRVVHAEPGRGRLVAERTFAQHGLLGSPHTLAVTVALAPAEGSPGAVASADVRFDLPVRWLAAEPDARWLDTSVGWDFALTSDGHTATIVLSYRGSVGPHSVTESTFGLALTSDADLTGRLTLATSSPQRDTAYGQWTSPVAIAVDRLEF